MVSHIFSTVPIRVFEVSLTYKLKYCQLDAVDDEKCQIIESCLVKAMAFLREAARKDGGKVLIHCSAGMTRSATMAVEQTKQEQTKTTEETSKAVVESIAYENLDDIV